MKEAKTLAHINLFGILGTLPCLTKFDESSLAYMPDKPLVIKFTIRHGPELMLKFSRNGVEHTNKKQDSASIVLFFGSHEHFNRMMDIQANPFIVYGFSKLGFLTKKFTPLTEKLAFFLKPTSKPECQTSKYKQINTELTLSVALNAAVQIANTDVKVAQTVKSLPDGVMLLSVKNGSAFHITVKHHQLVLHNGTTENYDAKMEFVDLNAAQQVLSGETDSFSAIATESLSLSGFLPLLDGLDKLLFRTNFYLNENA